MLNVYRICTNKSRFSVLLASLDFTTNSLAPLYVTRVIPWFIFLTSCHLFYKIFHNKFKMLQKSNFLQKYKLKRCSNKECCKQCRYVMFKGTMTKWPVQKLAESFALRLLEIQELLASPTLLPVVTKKRNYFNFK